MAEPRTAESLGRRKRRSPPDRLCTVFWMRGREATGTDNGSGTGCAFPSLTWA
ncbi:MAG: hypothetical protein ACKJRS_09200 [Woeseiaceae bacterium]